MTLNDHTPRKSFFVALRIFAVFGCILLKNVSYPIFKKTHNQKSDTYFFKGIFEIQGQKII